VTSHQLPVLELQSQFPEQRYCSDEAAPKLEDLVPKKKDGDVLAFEESEGFFEESSHTWTLRKLRHLQQMCLQREIMISLMLPWNTEGNASLVVRHRLVGQTAACLASVYHAPHFLAFRIVRGSSSTKHITNRLSVAISRGVWEVRAKVANGYAIRTNCKLRLLVGNLAWFILSAVTGSTTSKALFTLKFPPIARYIQSTEVTGNVTKRDHHLNM
jgi:hypothetical protein